MKQISRRDKEFWLIPKRANLHQSVALLTGIVELHYDKKTWSTSKQDRLGSYLGKKGATKNGKNITPQALRTLLASIPQYFGFVFINTNTTPSTLFVTSAGNEIIKEFEKFLKDYDYPNLHLAENENGTISYSDIFLTQFLKLQITNPVILKDCENVFVLPLIFTLKVLKETKHLTYEELAYFVFKTKSQSDLELTIIEIENFRKLDFESQLKLIDAFKRTNLGNISLVKAPSTSYFQKLCSYTGLIKKSEITLIGESEQRKLSTIILNEDKLDLIDEIISNNNLEPYDFRRDLELWLKYIGDTRIQRMPSDIIIVNNSVSEQLIVVKENNHFICGDLLPVDGKLVFPALQHYNYTISVYDKSNGRVLKDIEYILSDETEISITEIKNGSINVLSKTEIEKEIIDHINSRNFSHNFLSFLKIIENLTEKEYQNSKNLRGARLEHLFYLYFKCLMNDGVIDDIIWYGRISGFGIPTPSPGGSNGKPDIILFIDDYIVVVELTTIKSKSSQWSAEGASVPDHLRLIESEYPDKQIFALYLAPVIHTERVTKAMLSRLENYESKLICLEIENFINNLKGEISRNSFIDYLHIYNK